MKLISRLKKIKEYPRFVLFQILIDRITFRIIQVRRFHLLEYAGCPDAANTRGPGQVRQAGPADINGMAMLEHSGKGEIFRRRFSEGDHCAAAVRNEKIIGYEWYTCTSPHQEQRYGYIIQVPPEAIYAYDAFIAPGYRISGIWVKLKKHVGEHMRRLGKRRIITLIDADNTLSLNTHLRFGFTVFKSVALVKVAGKMYFREKKRDVHRTEKYHDSTRRN